MLDGRRLREFRHRCGEVLAREHPAPADVVVGVPRSGLPAAEGFASAAGLPAVPGLLRAPTARRSFIEPTAARRIDAVRATIVPVPDLVAGRRVVLVDDSVVRGTTTGEVVAVLRRAGATQVHLRVAAPMVRHPCRYGIDMPDEREMVAHRRGPTDVARLLGAESAGYLSLDGLRAAMPVGGHGHCTACFSGTYPVGGDEVPAKDMFESVGTAAGPSSAPSEGPST